MADVFSNTNEVLLAVRLAISRIEMKEPADLRALRTGQLPIGTRGQYGSTWEFAWSLFRDLAMGAWYPLVRLCQEHDQKKSRDLYSNEQIVVLMQRLNEPYMSYLRFNNFTEMTDLYDGVAKFAPSASREQLHEVACGFLRYLNRYTSYAMFYFDWKSLSDKHRYDPERTAPSSKPDLSRRVQICGGRLIKISWAKLDTEVYAYLASNENRVLCAAFIEALPFETLHIHAMVSGASTYAWTPLVTTASAPVKERQCDAPTGRLRFSQATGMKFVMQYGIVTEDIETPVLGEILPEYHDVLRDVGNALWDSTYHTKEEIKVRIELCDRLACKL